MWVKYCQSIVSTMIELSPWLFVGAAIAGILHILLPADYVAKHLSGRGGVLKSVLFGVPLPLCSCGVIPVVVGMRKKQASRGAVVGFLISTPQTGIDSILVASSMLGWPLAIFKVIVALVTGWLGGWLVSSLDREPAPAKPSDFQLPVLDVDRSSAAKSKSPPIHWSAAVKHAWSLIESLWLWLVIGVAVSAAITTLLPTIDLGGISSPNGIGGIVAALLISLPLYVCATASVPIAAALVAGGFPVGAAIVFLMAGPATNVSTLGVVYQTLGKKALAIYLLVILLGSISAGLAFQWIWPNSQATVLQHEHNSWYGIASAIALTGLLLFCALRDISRLARRVAANYSSVDPSLPVRD